MSAHAGRTIDRLPQGTTRRAVLIVLLVAANAVALRGGSGAGPPPAAASLADGARPSVEEAPPRSITIVGSGDILIHSALAERALANGGGRRHDFRPMFDEIKPIVEDADLALCHLETPLTRNDAEVTSYPLFNAPHELADAIADTGYDACSTASNHSIDQGTQGVEETLDILDAAGLEHYGTARRPRERKRPVVVEAAGVRVGLVSYTYGLNGLVLPENEPWRVNVIAADAIVRDARKARKAGAEVVVASLHWGLEYQPMPTPDQTTVARRVLGSGEVDVILGHHAHVVQPIDRVRGRYVVYGLGNLVSGQYPGASAGCCPEGTQDGVLVAVTLTERARGRFAARSVSYAPTLVERDTWRILPVAETLASGDVDPTLRSALEASWARTSDVIKAMGGRRFGVRPIAERPEG